MEELNKVIADNLENEINRLSEDEIKKILEEYSWKEKINSSNIVLNPTTAPPKQKSTYKGLSNIGNCTSIIIKLAIWIASYNPSLWIESSSNTSSNQAHLKYAQKNWRIKNCKENKDNSLKKKFRIALNLSQNSRKHLHYYLNQSEAISLLQIFGKWLPKCSGTAVSTTPSNLEDNF